MRSNDGFTLIELLVVVVIVGVLIGIAVPRFVDLTGRSRLAADQATVRTLNSVTTLSRMSESSPDPFADASKNSQDLLQALVEGQFLVGAVEPQTPEAQFAWSREDERWYLLVGNAIYTVSLIDGLSLNGVMLGSWSGSFGDAETYTGSSTSIIIPAQINGSTIERIGRHAFREVGLVSVIFEHGNQIQRIHTDAFRGNFLAAIVFPVTLEQIDMRAFQDNNFTAIELPSNVNRIEQQAFAGNPLTRITIGPSVNDIGHQAFGVHTEQFKAAYAAGGAGTYALINGVWEKQ